MKRTLLVFVINECEGMRQTLPRILPEWVDQRILVDGGSTDGSQDYARSLGYEVVVQERPGLFNALRQVYPLIRGESAVTFSPDGNCVPEVIPQLFEKLEEGYDMVIGSRYLSESWSKDDTWLSAFGNWAFTNSINLLFGGSYTDAMVNFRAYRTTLLPELGLLDYPKHSVEHYVASIASWEPLMSMRAAKQKVRMAEIPAPEPARLAGERKCSHFKGGAIYLAEMLQEAVFRRFEKNHIGRPAEEFNLKIKGR